MLGRLRVAPGKHEVNLRICFQAWTSSSQTSEEGPQLACRARMFRSVTRIRHCADALALSIQSTVVDSRVIALTAWRTASKGSCPAGFATVARALPSTATSRLQELAGLYKQLSKFRLSLLVMTTATAGFVAGMPSQLQAMCWRAYRPGIMQAFPW